MSTYPQWLLLLRSTWRQQQRFVILFYFCLNPPWLCIPNSLVHSHIKSFLTCGLAPVLLFTTGKTHTFRIWPTTWFRFVLIVLTFIIMKLQMLLLKLWLLSVSQYQSIGSMSHEYWGRSLHDERGEAKLGAWARNQKPQVMASRSSEKPEKLDSAAGSNCFPPGTWWTSRAKNEYACKRIAVSVLLLLFFKIWIFFLH